VRTEGRNVGSQQARAEHASEWRSNARRPSEIIVHQSMVEVERQIGPGAFFLETYHRRERGRYIQGMIRPGHLWSKKRINHETDDSLKNVQGHIGQGRGIVIASRIWQLEQAQYPH
jgi:hypothetical protein